MGFKKQQRRQNHYSHAIKSHGCRFSEFCMDNVWESHVSIYYVVCFFRFDTLKTSQTINNDWLLVRFTKHYCVFINWVKAAYLIIVDIAHSLQHIHIKHSWWYGWKAWNRHGLQKNDDIDSQPTKTPSTKFNAIDSIIRRKTQRISVENYLQFFIWLFVKCLCNKHRNRLSERQMNIYMSIKRQQQQQQKNRDVNRQKIERVE